MKRLIALALALAISSPVDADRGRKYLTDYEKGVTVGTANTAYSIALLTIDTGTLTTGADPYICWPFPVQWDMFYRLIEHNVVLKLSKMTKKERHGLGENFKYVAWQATLDAYGCYE